MPRLKKKIELNYRKGSTNESTNCRYCINYRPQELIGNKIEKRCSVMGIRESIRYRVRPDFKCDAQKYNGK